MSTWKVIGLGIVGLVILEAIRFISDNLFWFLVAVAIVLVVAFTAAVQKSVRQKEEEAFAAKVKVTTRTDFIRGKHIASELGWVRVKGCSSTEEVEQKLKTEAGRLDANGLVKYHWTPRKESFVAGRGKKGNPYYQTRTVYDGEGVAVRWKERQTPITGSSKGFVSAGYPSGWVALDGNNIFGTIYSQTEDVEGTFKVMSTLLQKFAHSPYKVHIFWDGKFITFLNALDEESRGRRLMDVLLQKFPIGQETLTISRKGQRVDDIIVPWAHAKNAAIVSSDNFSKPEADALIMSKANELRSRGLLLKPDYIAGEVIVPGLTAL